jgi:hypothetical protein
MQRAWRIFVVVAILAVLFAPKMAFCFALSHPAHACCATETQMAAQHCCPDAVPQVPAAVTSHVDCASQFQASTVLFAFIKVEGLCAGPVARASVLPNQPPDTILRT